MSWTLPNLLTETRNPASAEIDALPTLDMLRVINAADREVAVSVEREIASIARAVDAITDRLEEGGRLFYVGAGTSGRLGVLDASECPPTFNTPPDLVQGIIAGGDRALRHSVERAEDDAELGRKDLIERDFGAGDAVVGIAASGRTPYVLGALAHARSLGALTVGLSCTPDSEVARAAEIAITPTSRSRDRYWLDSYARGHRDQAGSEYAKHGRDDPHGLRLRQPDGQHAGGQ